MNENERERGREREREKKIQQEHVLTERNREVGRKQGSYTTKREGGKRDNKRRRERKKEPEREREGGGIRLQASPLPTKFPPDIRISLSAGW